MAATGCHRSAQVTDVICLPNFVEMLSVHIFDPYRGQLHIISPVFSLKAGGFFLSGN